MRKLLIALVIFGNSLVCISTPQIPDLLIVGKDTFMLYSFPLASLNIEKYPFDYRGFPFPSTACWRGYQATWKILDNQLILIQVIKVDSTKEKLDIIKYLKENNLSPTILNGFVFADWYSAKFRYFARWDRRLQNYIYAYSKILFPVLEIKNGYVIKNHLSAL
jgi:hypothetical protein